MAGRKVISRSAADRIIGDRIIAEQIIEEAVARGPVRTILDGATAGQTDAPMDDSQEKTGMVRAVPTTVVRMQGGARFEVPSNLSPKRIS